MADARRQRLLEAMGVTLYRQRARASVVQGDAAPANVGAPAEIPATHAALHEAAPLSLVIVGARGDRAYADTLARALALMPPQLAFIEATPERLASPPPQAGAYIALGAVFARPLGVELPTTVQQAAQIVVTSAPSEWRNASAKRVLWQTLKPLRRALARS
jgi:hypothetical protein